MMLKIQT